MLSVSFSELHSIILLFEKLIPFLGLVVALLTFGIMSYNPFTLYL